MPAIRVFADKLASEPAEVHQAAAGITLAEWLRANVPAYRDLPTPPISATLNGALLPPGQWRSRVLREGDVLELVVEPGGLTPFEWVMAVVAVLSAAYSIYAMNNLPDAPKDVGQASSIYDPNAQGNKPRLMRPIPELLGRHPVYPDYICQPRRAYVDDELWLYLNLSLGRGTYTCHDILIGNTSVANYADDIDYQITPPGGDVTTHEAHRNVYTSPEVGSTASTSGIELTAPPAYADATTTEAVFSGNQMQLRVFRWTDSTHNFTGYTEPIAWPWPAGLHVTVSGASGVVSQFSATGSIVDGDTQGAVTYGGIISIYDGLGAANPIVAANGAGLDVFAVDDQVKLTGAGVNDGTYYVATVSAGSITLKDALGNPVTTLTPMESVFVTITRTSSGQPDEIRSASGYGLAVFTPGQEVVLSGAGVNDGTYYIRTATDSAVTLQDALGNAITNLTPMSGVLLTLTSTASNDGTYRIDSVADTWATVTKVDPDTLAPIAGWTGFDTALTQAATVTVIDDDRAGDWVGPFVACPDGETTDRIWVSLAWRQGLVRIDSGGNRQNRTVTVDIEYRAAGSSDAWQRTTFTRTANSIDELGSTVEIVLPEPMRPEVRVRRVTPTVDSMQIRDRVEWVSLQAQLATPTRYDEVTTLQIAIRGTNALASSAENKIRVDAERHLPAYIGGAWQPAAPSQSIADAALYVLRDAGYIDAQLDLAEFERLRSLWESRGDTFCGVFDQPSTVFECVKQILACGYAEPTIDWGQITPVRDEPRTAWDHVYTPDVMTGEGLERDIVLWDPNEPDGVEVEYFDPVTAKPATVLCTLPGDLALRPETVKAFGITDRTRAWRFGMRRRRALRYRNTKLSWETELAGLNSTYGSYCAVTDGIPGQAQSGRVAAVSGRRLTLDRAPEWGEGVHYLALRAPDGSLVGPFTAAPVAGDPYSVDLDGDPGTVYPEDDPTYQVPTLWAFGPADQWCVPALVREVRTQGEDAVQIEAVRYDPRVYADDDNEPPA